MGNGCSKACIGNRDLLLREFRGLLARLRFVRVCLLLQKGMEKKGRGAGSVCSHGSARKPSKAGEADAQLLNPATCSASRHSAHDGPTSGAGKVVGASWSMDTAAIDTA